MKSTRLTVGTAGWCGLTLLVGLALSAAAMAVPSVSESAASRVGIPRYELTRLLPLPGDTYTGASGINEEGVVVGSSYSLDYNSRPALWPRNGPAQYLGSLGGKYGHAHDINDSGQVVGSSDTAVGNPRGFLWTNGTMQRLEPLSGGSYCLAFCINSQGVVVGESVSTAADGKTEFTRAVLWRNGIPEDLGTLGGDDSWAGAINDAGDIVGASSTGQDLDNDGYEDWYAFVWREGRMEPLPPLPGYAGSAATDIDRRGNVMGSCFSSNGSILVRWSEGVPRSIEPRRRSWTVGGVINDKGVIAETAGSWDDNSFVYVRKSGKRALLQRMLNASRRFSPRWAADINDRGVIAGSGDEWRGHVAVLLGFIARPIR